MTNRPTHLKRLLPHILRADIERCVITAPTQLYMVLGLARGCVRSGTELHIVGNFEAHVLGNPTTFMSLECWLPGTELISLVIAEHVMRAPYEVGLVFFANPDPDLDYKIGVQFSHFRHASEEW